jgi:hypothetical protein
MTYVAKTAEPKLGTKFTGTAAPTGVHARGLGPSNRALLRLQRNCPGATDARPDYSVRSKLALQSKRSVVPADDQYEREADQVAERVMRGAVLPDHSSVHLPRESGVCGGALGPTGECRESRGERLSPGRETRHSDVRTRRDSSLQIVSDVLRSPGQPLDSATRVFMEQRFGCDFSAVRVHTDCGGAASARAINALAYTMGHDVVFGTAQYSPGTAEGRRLLAHELVHVLQQTSPVFPSSATSHLEQSGNVIHRSQIRPDAPISRLGVPVLQRQEGGSDNEGTAPAQQAFLSDSDLVLIAGQVHNGIAGLGTDEEVVYRALQKLRRDPEAIKLLKEIYRQRYKVDLVEDIYDDFSGTELEYALQLLNMGTKDSKQRISLTPEDPQISARRIRDAVEGWGTDEEAIFAVLEPLNRNPQMTGRLRTTYYKMYREDLRDRLIDEMSGSELQYALDLLELPYEHYIQEANDRLAGGRMKERIGFGFSWDRKGWFDDTYWVVMEDKDFPLHKLVQVKGRPSEAMDALFDHQERWHVDCAEFVQILQLYALRHTLGPAEFNKRVGGQLELKVHGSSGVKTRNVFERKLPGEARMKRSSDGKEDPRTVDRILDETPIGSRVRWSNQTLIDHLENMQWKEVERYGGDNPPWAAFLHENAVKLGPNNFGAQGFFDSRLKRLFLGPTRSYTREDLEDKMVDYTIEQLEEVNFPADKSQVRQSIFISQIEHFENQ